jgi:hypothetical protein
MVRISKMIQGPDLADNVDSLVKMATLEDANVRELLLATGGIPAQLVSIPDNRYTCGYRIERQSTIVPKRAAMMWQARTGVTGACLRELRILAGKGVIDTPQALQKWALEQPEMPQIKFVPTGDIAVYAPPVDLMSKITSELGHHIRTVAPYDKGAKIHCFYLVTVCLDCRVIACAIYAVRQFYDLNVCILRVKLISLNLERKTIKMKAFDSIL